MKILLTAFAGEANSSKLLIDKVNNKNKLILENDFLLSSKQIIEAIDSLKPDIIISFGQKPKSSRLFIETQAKKEDVIKTNFTIDILLNSLIKNDIDYKVSDNAGSYLCNHIYYDALKYISNNELNTKIVFIHVPDINNFTNFDKVITWLNNYLENLKKPITYNINGNKIKTMYNISSRNKINI